MPTKALVLGSSGYLGQRVLRSGVGRYQPLLIPRVIDDQDLPILAARVEAEMRRYPQACLINCLGLRSGSVSQLELVNSRVPEVLTRSARRTGTWLVHLGSAAEVVQLATQQSARDVDVSASSYGRTKAEGTQACLQYEGATVLRIYNLHGLPHQATSGLHEVCTAIAKISSGGSPEGIVNTTRDYVHVESVVQAVTGAVDNRQPGLRQICTGLGISIGEIVEQLPDRVSAILSLSLIEPDRFAPVIGPEQSQGSGRVIRSTLLDTLRAEVMQCASS
jgi:nucleoside-diphosphate-sugar epimerase